MINSQLETVSKAYASSREHAMNDILKNKLKKSKTFSWKYCFCTAQICNTRFKAIEQLITCQINAPGKYNNSGYMFYENKDGFFILEVLESMLAMGNSSGTTRCVRTQIQMVEDGVSTGKI